MDDREHMMEVDRMLEGAWQVDRDLRREYTLFYDAGAALISEVSDPNFSLGRFEELRQAMEKPRRRTGAAYQKQDKILKELQESLRGWKSPGGQYERFSDQAWRSVMVYIGIMEKTFDEARSVMALVELYRRSLTAAGR